MHRHFDNHPFLYMNELQFPIFQLDVLLAIRGCVTDFSAIRSAIDERAWKFAAGGWCIMMAMAGSKMIIIY